MMVKVVFGVVLFLACVATGTSRYRYERPSRVVEIKQGRLQGTMVEVPLTSPFSSNGDKNQVKNEPQKDYYNILSENQQKNFLPKQYFFGDVQTIFMYSYVRYTHSTTQ